MAGGPSPVGAVKLCFNTAFNIAFIISLESMAGCFKILKRTDRLELAILSHGPAEPAYGPIRKFCCPSVCNCRVEGGTLEYALSIFNFKQVSSDA